MAQGRAAIPKPNIIWPAAPWGTASPPVLPFSTLERAQPALLAAQMQFWEMESQAHLLPASLPYSPHIMGQEGPHQPYPNHQEEADKDEAVLHSWRGSERRNAEGPAARGRRPLYRGMQSCQILEALAKVDGSPERGLGKGYGFCRGEPLGMLEKFQEGFGGLARERVRTSQGSEEDLEGVTGREFTLFHQFVAGPR